ncbi:MAG: FtsW/RodA/SpoVE family cell cycle protein [Longimicrobiales bacterium]
MAEALALDGRAVVHSLPIERGARLSGWEAPMLLLLAMLLLSIGLVTVYSTSAVKAQAQGLADYHYVIRQAAGGALGLALLAAAAWLDYRRLRLLAWPGLFLVTAALFVMVLPGTQTIAPVVNGARRWLYLGPIIVQPSEFAKVALIAWTAALAVKKQERLSSLSRGLLPFLVVWLVVAGLIFLEPSLSAAAITILLAALVLFAGGARIGHLLLLAIVGLPLVWAKVGDAVYRVRRIATFLDPNFDVEGMSYQINQSLIAIGSGGIFGRGFGHGQQKYGFLPEPFNDFIFAMFGEEWGLLGIILLIVLFTAFALIGYRIARGAPDLFGALLAVGLTNLIAVQAFLHMAVNLALTPTTGVTLPFMSYGRSSLLVCMFAVGVLINIARQAERRTE